MVVGTAQKKSAPVQSRREDGVAPVCGNLIVTLRDKNPAAEVTVTVYSLSGRVLGTRSVRESRVDLRKDFSLPYGTYLVKTELRR